MDEVGARDAPGRVFVTGTRRDAAAERGGRTEPFPGRGGAGIWPKVGGFRRGGLADLLAFGTGGRGGGIVICGSSFVSSARFPSTDVVGSPSS